MANWQRKIVLNPEWELARDGEFSMQHLAAAIAQRLKALTPFSDDELEEGRQDIIWEFEQISKSDDATTSDIDAAMEALYDWGDTRMDDVWNGRKACWVDTFSSAPGRAPNERSEGSP